MKLTAAIFVGEVELGRYLRPCVDHLLDFCDTVVLMQDGGGAWGPQNGEWWPADRVSVCWYDGRFFDHEGRARQALLEATLCVSPTHVLNIDADEFVSDGPALRAALEASDCPTFELEISEVWGCDTKTLRTREDGGWGTHPVTIAWHTPMIQTVEWRIRDRALACGRVPEMVETYSQMNCVDPTGVTLYHFGWANEAARAARYQRYVEHDGGRFHSRTHLDSIMWDDDSVTLLQHSWPAGLAAYRDQIVRVANGLP